MSDHYVLLGLSRRRLSWFARVATWCTDGVLPAQFAKCLSAAEVRARLDSGRLHSALLVDADARGLDRDLIDSARSRACAVIVVAAAELRVDTEALGIAGRLNPDFDRGDLLGLLASVAQIVPDTLSAPSDPVPEAVPGPWTGQLVAVCGTGGTGASTAAIAVAQVLGSDVRHRGLVALADLALHADQALLHGTPDVAPGVPELVDAHSRGRPDPAALQHGTFDVAARGYRLLLGLRRHAEWARLRPQAVRAAIVALMESFGVTVADVDADLEGDDECGVVGIEDRNLLARTTIALADVVCVVAAPGLKGLHALARCAQDLVGFDVPAERIIPVVNRAPRRPAQRAEFTAAFHGLVPAVVHPPVFLPERNGIEAAHRDVSRLPDALCGPLGGAVSLALERPRRTFDVEGPRRVRPGFGSWTDQDTAAR